MKWDIYEEPHKLFCDNDSEVAVDAVADVVEVFLLLKKDELIVGIGAGLQLLDEGGAAVFDYHVFETKDRHEDGLFEDVVLGLDHYAMAAPVIEAVLCTKEVGGETCDVVVFT